MEKAGYTIEVAKDNPKHALGMKAQELHAMLRKWIGEQQKQKQNKPDATANSGA